MAPSSRNEGKRSGREPALDPQLAKNRGAARTESGRRPGQAFLRQDLLHRGFVFDQQSLVDAPVAFRPDDARDFGNDRIQIVIHQQVVEKAARGDFVRRAVYAQAP